MNNIIYTKKREVKFLAQKIRLFNISAFESIKVSFYEKYIILMLLKGIKADSVYELCEIISEILNIHIDCVTELIEYLMELYLIDQEKYETYKMRSNIDIKNENNSMYLNLKEVFVDCNKIIYVHNLERFFLEQDFDKNKFKMIFAEKNTKLDYLYHLINENEDVKKVLRKYFINYDYYLPPNFTYDLDKNYYSQYYLQFNVDIKYAYNVETKKSEIIDIYFDDYFKEYETAIIKYVNENYSIDDKIPNFFTVSDQLTNDIRPSIDTVRELKLFIKNLQNDIKELKNQIEQLSKQKKKIEKQKNKVNNDLSEKNTPFFDLFNSENDIVSQLEEINNQLKENCDILKEKEKLLSSKHEDLTQLQRSIQKSIRSKEWGLDDVIKQTLDKYKNIENYYCLYEFIEVLCLSIDSAIQASPYDMYNEIFIGIMGVRDNYRRLMHCIFQVLFKTQTFNFKSFIKTSNEINNMKSLFAKRKVDIDLVDSIVYFHNISGATGHEGDNSSLKELNKDIIDEFKAMDHHSRKKVLLSVPRFLLSIKLNDSELLLIDQLVSYNNE